MSEEVWVAPYEPDRGPESYPPRHPLHDPWHHELCVCGHKRVGHYDEHAVCLDEFELPSGDLISCSCEQFKLAPPAVAVTGTT